ncbi:MAG TPA: DinB family protein [Candidatus Dormibacteraeota bacterium]|nr:DinB family protein [Candidatus Dormibacteraeota bacterium]
MKQILAVIVLCLFATLASAQAPVPAAKPAAPAAAPTKDPVATSLRILLQRSQTNVVGAVEAMPADKFSYKPTPDQMTFAHLVVHIIGSNNTLCSKVADVPAPKADEPKETDSKDQMLAAVKASYTFCSDALSKMDDSKLGDDVELFGGRHFPRAMAALGLASGWADHYGAAAMYLRLNGILPPSAQQKH